MDFHALAVRCFSLSAGRILLSPLPDVTHLSVCLQWLPVQKPQWTPEGFAEDLETIPLNAAPPALQKRMENGEREARHETPMQLDVEMACARLLALDARVLYRQRGGCGQPLGEGLLRVS